jgi:hypothetical protein
MKASSLKIVAAPVLGQTFLGLIWRIVHFPINGQGEEHKLGLSLGRLPCCLSESRNALAVKKAFIARCW